MLFSPSRVRGGIDDCRSLPSKGTASVIFEGVIGSQPHTFFTESASEIDWKKSEYIFSTLDTFQLLRPLSGTSRTCSYPVEGPPGGANYLPGPGQEGAPGNLFSHSGRDAEADGSRLGARAGRAAILQGNKRRSPRVDAAGHCSRVGGQHRRQHSARHDQVDARLVLLERAFAKAGRRLEPPPPPEGTRPLLETAV